MADQPLPADPGDALRLLRDRFRAASPRIVSALDSFAARLAAAPHAADLLDALRRELHRVHGTAGSYGFATASTLAGEMERRVVAWIADARVDAAARHAIVAEFARTLARAFASDEGAGVRPAP